MSDHAAIFDLDRTLLRGASGPLLNQALRDVGLRGSQLPGESLLYRYYEVFGENPLGIALARAAAFGVRGWEAERLREAGVTAALRLVDHVARYAPSLLEEHRCAGRLLVLATTSPYDLVKPLADRLKMDEVIATRYASINGCYTGRLDGGFVWGAGKLSAVRSWAERRGVSLAGSYAYSDSVYDLPLLSAVGHPAAVNPDLALHAAAMLRRWPVLHLGVPPGVPTLAGFEALDVGRFLIRPEFFPYARFRLEGLEQLPNEGAFLLVSNHRSYFDVAALGLLIARKGRRVRFLGKQELFDAPVVGQLARALGGIPVDRARDPGRSLDAASQVLLAGEGLAVLPQGTIPRGRAFFDPVLKGKTGAARLAARTGVPVVPVGVWNSEAVWPRSARLPRIGNVLNPPLVAVRVGRAVSGLGLGPRDAVSDTETIMQAISDLLPPAGRQRCEPSEQDIARTYPPGSSRDGRMIGQRATAGSERV
ncbi:MAG: HAD-IB family hydrolase [Acidimicrobiales bacterium]